MMPKEILDKVLSIGGWTTEAELNWLYDTASKIEDGFIVEIGAWKGRSTAALCFGAPASSEVYTIDTFAGTQTPQEKDFYKEVNGDNIFELFFSNMKRLCLNPHVIRLNSVEASRLFADESIDLLFIDGDHFRVKEDIVAFAPAMKETGLLCGHDYGWQPVLATIEELDLIVKTPAGNIWVVSNPLEEFFFP